MICLVKMKNLIFCIIFIWGRMQSRWPKQCNTVNTPFVECSTRERHLKALFCWVPLFWLVFCPWPSAKHMFTEFRFFVEFFFFNDTQQRYVCLVPWRNALGKHEFSSSIYTDRPGDHASKKDYYGTKASSPHVWVCHFLNIIMSFLNSHQLWLLLYISKWYQTNYIYI